VNKPDQVYADGRLKPAFFRDRTGLSVDLARFSTPEVSRVGHAEKPYPTESGLVELRVSDVRQAGTDIRHEPVSQPRRNYAHSQLTSVPGQAGLEALSKVATFRIDQRFKKPR
jgi:hypothetical protein